MLSRWGPGTLLLAAVLVGAGYACREGAEYLSRSGDGEAARLDREARRASRLEASWADLCDRIETRARVVAEVSAGRLSLFEAAVRFRALDLQVLEPDVNTIMLRRQFAGESDGERYCRKVIDYIRGAEETRGEPTPVARRLEAELTEHLRRHGTVRLPTGRPE
jgi:hypothetical protein